LNVLSNTECFEEVGLEVPGETDNALLEKVKKNTLTKAALASWYERRVDLLEGALSALIWAPNSYSYIFTRNTCIAFQC
jgi:hypothetical protein